MLCAEIALVCALASGDARAAPWEKLKKWLRFGRPPTCLVQQLMEQDQSSSRLDNLSASPVDNGDYFEQVTQRLDISSLTRTEAQAPEDLQLPVSERETESSIVPESVVVRPDHGIDRDRLILDVIEAEDLARSLEAMLKYIPVAKRQVINTILGQNKALLKRLEQESSRLDPRVIEGRLRRIRGENERASGSLRDAERELRRLLGDSRFEAEVARPVDSRAKKPVRSDSSKIRAGEFNLSEGQTFIERAKEDSKKGPVAVVMKDGEMLRCKVQKAILCDNGSLCMLVEYQGGYTDQLPLDQIDRSKSELAMKTFREEIQIARTIAQEEEKKHWDRMEEAFVLTPDVSRRRGARSKGRDEFSRPKLGKKSLVVDSQVAIPLNARARGERISKTDRRFLSWADRQIGRGYEIRITDRTSLEKGPGIIPNVRGISLKVSRSSRVYKDFFTRLREPPAVGTIGGFPDREIVADLFFAEAIEGEVPTLVTADAGVYKPLAQRANLDLDNLVGRYEKDGFIVTLDDLNGVSRSIRVIPIP